MTNHYTIANFQEGVVLRELGPLYLAQEYPEVMLSNYDTAWRNFLRLMGEADNDRSRSRWRRKGYRRVKVEVSVEFVQEHVTENARRK